VFRLSGPDTASPAPCVPRKQRFAELIGLGISHAEASIVWKLVRPRAPLPVAFCGKSDACTLPGRQQPILAKVNQRNELPAIRSNPHSYWDPAASDGEQPILTRLPVGPFMPEHVDGAQRIYSVVFVVVLLSVICQGTLAGLVARRLGVPIRDRPSTA
jgi:hypothetical protein